MHSTDSSNKTWPLRAMLLAAAWLAITTACAFGQDAPPAAACAPCLPPAENAEEEPDPTKREVSLPASAGWKGTLVIDNGEVGIWTVRVADVFPQFGAHEILGLDDKGRCYILYSYSGKWTPIERVNDGQWLGGLAHEDVDPRVAGSEIYTGGLKGNLYQLTVHPHGAIDSRFLAYFPGCELHTIVSGDLDPRSGGKELLVFTNPGAIYRVSPTGPHDAFESTLLEELPGRVRDAVVLPRRGDGPAEIATVSRAGRMEVLSITSEGPRWSLILELPMGMGRIAMKPPEPGRPVVLYATADDGRIVRAERAPDAVEWRHETIFLGAQGPRGVTAGRFDADPDAETLALFGYSGEVILLTRTGDTWQPEVIFEDRDKGHWLAAGELDGRNATLEIIGSGYGGRVFLLARPPGYGRPAIATRP